MLQAKYGIQPSNLDHGSQFKNFTMVSKIQLFPEVRFFAPIYLGVGSFKANAFVKRQHYGFFNLHRSLVLSATSSTSYMGLSSPILMERRFHDYVEIDSNHMWHTEVINRHFKEAVFLTQLQCNQQVLHT